MRHEGNKQKYYFWEERRTDEKSRDNNRRLNVESTRSTRREMPQSAQRQRIFHQSSDVYDNTSFWDGNIDKPSERAQNRFLLASLAVIIAGTSWNNTPTRVERFKF